jgi:hypothetical protein
MKKSIYYNNCKLSVLGIDMNCPMCGALVKSGETHQCSNPKPKQKVH